MGEIKNICKNQVNPDKYSKQYQILKRLQPRKSWI